MVYDVIMYLNVYIHRCMESVTIDDSLFSMIFVIWSVLNSCRENFNFLFKEREEHKSLTVLTIWALKKERLPWRFYRLFYIIQRIPNLECVYRVKVIFVFNVFLRIYDFLYKYQHKKQHINYEYSVNECKRNFYVRMIFFFSRSA